MVGKQRFLFQEGIGKINLNVGLNELEVKVNKLDGTNEKYILEVNRGYEENKDYESATLKSLEVVGHNIGFEENKFDYSIKVKE